MSIAKEITTKKYGWTNSNECNSHSFIAPKIIEICKKYKYKKILDIGCGNGALCRILKNEDFNIIGCDADEDGIKYAQKANPTINFKVVSIYEDFKELGENNFDAIIATEVIEHLYYPQKLIEFANNILAEGGDIIISTPYHGYLKNFALSLFNKWDDHHCVFWDGGHIKFWSKSTITKLLKNNNYQIKRFCGVGRIPYLWKSMIIVANKI